MTKIDLTALDQAPRLLLEAELKPLQGTRFQPTGFPDLGAAEYKLPSSEKRMILLESPQSVANRLELTVWDEVTEDLVEPLQGIPYVKVEIDGEAKTNSILEAHRLNSNYILESEKKDFLEQLQTELKVADTKTGVDFHQLAVVLAKYDFNSLLHGIFLAKKELSGGRFKLARSLSGFIEAENVEEVASGGVKNDRLDPKGDAQSGGGNIPFHRKEYAAEKITAFFNLDLAQIRGYRLGTEVEKLLILLALWKIQKFLNEGLRLRTACDLKCCDDIQVTQPQGFKIPKLDDLTAALPDAIAAAKGHFADPPITTVQYVEKKSKKDKKNKEENS